MALVVKNGAKVAVSIGMENLKAHGNKGKFEHASGKTCFVIILSIENCLVDLVFVILDPCLPP